ncbi:MAG: hypothetical protein U0235_15950 [Polyangiaceae bacterium]
MVPRHEEPASLWTSDAPENAGDDADLAIDASVEDGAIRAAVASRSGVAKAFTIAVDVDSLRHAID